METPVLLIDEEYRGSHGRFRWSYALATKIFIQKLVQLFLFDWRKGVDLGAEVGGIGYKLDGMIPLLPIRQFVKCLFGKGVSEFLIRLGDYVFKASQAVIT